MQAGALVALEDYLNTSYHPDCDFVDGNLLERTVGKRKHAYAQAQVTIWLGARTALTGLQPLTGLRLRAAAGRVRIPDVVVAETPFPDEDVFTTPPYLCIEVMSPDDTMTTLQDRIDDYLAFGVPNVWVIDPWKHRGWVVSPTGWTAAADRIMRTADARLAMPLRDVLLP